MFTLVRVAEHSGALVKWQNFVGHMAGQSGTWTFASDDDAERFSAYASREPAPSLARSDLETAGIPLPVSCDEGWGIL